MVSSRAKILIKLLLLLGLPLVLTAALFGWGVHVGHKHRHVVMSFERDWLGMDVEVPPAPPPPPGDVEAPSPVRSKDAGPADTAATQPSGAGQPEGARSPSATPGLPSAPAVAAEGDLLTPPSPPAADYGPQAPAGAEPSEVVSSEAAPVEGPAAGTVAPGETKLDAAARLQLPVVVQLKVLVDQDLIDGHPDWIDYVQRTVGAASLVYQRNFGIVLELVSVGRWPVSTAGVDGVSLVQDLKGRSREGADVVLGFTARSVGQVAGHVDGARPEIPAPDAPYNGAYAVAAAHPGHPEPHLRTLLHALGHLFGAVDIDDPHAEAYRSGSWMSGAAVSPGSTPWIDATNRERILTRKDKPFEPETRPDAGGR